MDKDNNDKPSAPPVWYFAYGSNMAKSTLLRRDLTPLDSKAVLIPNHILCFEIFGVPYSEPSMASIRSRDNETDSVPPVHGTAYLLSAEEYQRMIISEGAGVAYEDVELQARIVEAGAAGVEAEITVRTLMARFPFRPEAIPSARYMNLIIQGAEEGRLPAEYIDYLKRLPQYQKSLGVFEEFGASLLLGFWMPVLSSMMRRVKSRAGSDSSVQPWVGKVVKYVFEGMWWYHDTIHCRIWGHNGGRRTN